MVGLKADRCSSGQGSPCADALYTKAVVDGCAVGEGAKRMLFGDKPEDLILERSFFRAPLPLQSNTRFKTLVTNRLTVIHQSTMDNQWF